MPGPLDNQRHELFCQHLVTGKLTQADAYREAGFKGSAQSMHANAARLIANDRVAARLAELREALFDKFEVSNDRVIRELALSAFARMGDYQALLATGRLDTISSEQTAAISQFTVERIAGEGPSENKEPDIIRTRLKLGDKLQSLIALAKIKGLMKEGGSEPLQVMFNVYRTERSNGRKD
jgi:phage terminase small subunit